MFVALYGFQTALTAATAANAGLLQIDPNEATAIAAQLGGSGTSYMSLSDGVNYELVKINSVNSPYLNVVRAQDGTTSFAFPEGACLRFEWTQEGIAAVASGTPPTIEGDGAAIASYDPVLNKYTINVIVPTIEAVALPALVLGAYPAWEIAFQNVNGGCCCGSGSGGGTGGPVTLTGTGVAVVTPAAPSDIYNVFVANPTFTGANGVTVSGTWPNFTITGSGVPVSGVLSVTGSTKILISGSSANPIFSLATNGALGAGTYNGVTYDLYGAIIAVNSGYVPVTSIIGDAITAFIPGGPGVYNVTTTLPVATTSVEGTVQLAVATNAASNNPGDPTSAVTPAGIAAVLAAQPPLPTIAFQSVNNYAADPIGNYTNVLAAALVLAVGASESVLITGLATATPDSAAPTFPPAWGLAIFSGAAILAGIQTLVTGSHVIQVVVNGPFAGTISLRTTALPGTSAIAGQSLTAIKIG